MDWIQALRARQPPERCWLPWESVSQPGESLSAEQVVRAAPWNLPALKLVLEP